MPSPHRLLAAAVPAAAATALLLPALATAAPPAPDAGAAALRAYVTSGAYLADVTAAVAPARAALSARMDQIDAQRTACQVAGVARAGVRAAIPTSTRGTVRLTVRRDLVPGLRVTATNASASARVVVLPVDTAAVSARAASVRTLGTITLARGTRRIALRSVRVALRSTSATVTASVAGRRITLARTPASSKRKAKLNAAGRAEVVAAQLQLTKAGRTALRRLAPRSNRFGLLTVQVEPARTSATPAAPGTPGGTTSAPPTTTTTPPTTPTIAVPTPTAPVPSFVPTPAACAAIPTQPTMVLDIDETALSAYLGTTGGDPGGGSAGQLPELAGTAKALAPVKGLYDLAVSRGVGVDFITGRIQSLQQAVTERNLDSEGYAQRIGVTYRQGNENSAAYKRDARAALQASGRTIVLNVGDQCSDLFGGNAERAFKLPNTFYMTDDGANVDPRCDKLGAGGEVPTS